MDTNILSPSFPFPMQEKMNQAAAIERNPTNVVKPPQQHHLGAEEKGLAALLTGEADEGKTLVGDQPNAPSNPPVQAAATAKSDSMSRENLLHPRPYVERTPPPPRPAQLPFLATEENIPRLETFISKQFASSAFNKVPPFPAMNAPPAHIHIHPNCRPYARHSPIPVPHHWKEEVKAGLDRDEKREIIAKPPIGSSVTWCSPMVIVQKHDGSPRRTVDFQRLNANCLRETHHTPSPFMLACQIPPQQKKTVLDAVDGYHAVKLDEESKVMTTFITEWGRYMYLRMPQGYLASGDAYTEGMMR